MKKFFLAALALLALAPFSFEAAAQTVVANPTFMNPCVRQASPLTGCILVDAANPLPVTASGSPSGTQDVNIKQVNGSNVTSVPINDNSGSLTVDGTVAATQSGTWTVQPGNTQNTTPWLVTATGNVASATSDSGNPVKVGAVFSSTVPTFSDGQRADLQVGSRGSLRVELFGASSGSGVPVTSSGGDAVTNTQIGLNVYGRNFIFNGSTWDRERSAIDGLNSVGTGIRAVGLIGQLDDTSPTAITENQFGNLRMTPNRALLVKPYAAAAQDWTYAAATGGITNSTTAVTMVGATASMRNYLTACQISADSLGAATELVVRDGAGGTVIMRSKIGTAGFSPTNVTYPTPLKSTANTLLEVATLTATITGGVYVNCQGYTAP